MIVENRGQQQSVRYVVDTARCCGCRRCIRRCQENVWQWDEEHHHAYPKYPDDLQVDPLEYSADLMKKSKEAKQ